MSKAESGRGMTRRVCALALIAGIALGAGKPREMGDWRVTIDKKPNEITGRRNAYAQVGAKGLNASELLVGCTDGRTVLRIVERFRAFRVTGGDGVYFSHVKLRASGSDQYIDADVQVQQNGGVMFLLLDDKAADLLPRMRTDELLLAQLSYNGRDEMTRFPMAGFDAALAKLAEAGCRP